MDKIIIKQSFDRIIGVKGSKNKIIINLVRGMEFPIGKEDHFQNRKKFFLIWITGYRFKLPTELIEFEKFWWN